MSTGLHLTTAEFGRMVACGAFDHLNRKIELIPGELREVNPAGPIHGDLTTYLKQLVSDGCIGPFDPGHITNRTRIGRFGQSACSRSPAPVFQS